MRVSLLATMALWGQLPLWHAAYLNYGAAAEAREATWTVVASLLIVGLGGFVYAVRVPERWLPGAFDLFGNSHNVGGWVGFKTRLLPWVQKVAHPSARTVAHAGGGSLPI